MSAIGQTIDRLFAALAPISRPGEGVTRPAYSAEEQAAHDLMAREAAALDLEVAADAIGNLYMTLPGRDRARPGIVIGSHLDSVPGGGAYDGAAGVVAGLALAAALRAEDARPPVDLTVMAVRAEESVWFPVSYLGSRGALGRLEPAALAARRSDTGQTLEQHLRAAGFDPEAIRHGRAALSPERVGAYLEVHIEQGPVLQQRGLPLGLVTGIRGGLRFREARITGAWSHSGATPRALRQDAGLALAEVMSGVERLWDEAEAAARDLVATFGIFGTEPARHAFSKVPGEVNFCLDLRSSEAALLDELPARLTALAAQVGAQRRVAVELGPISRSQPARMDDGLRRRLAAAAAAAELPVLELPSGGGHDAAAFAQAGIPAGLVFVRNDHGSHNPDEAMDHADLALAVELLRATLRAWPEAAADR